MGDNDGVELHSMAHPGSDFSPDALERVEIDIPVVVDTGFLVLRGLPETQVGITRLAVQVFHMGGDGAFVGRVPTADEVRDHAEYVAAEWYGGRMNIPPSLYRFIARAIEAGVR